MTVYIRARDGVPVSEEEALTASGTLKDGYRCSMGRITRDSAPSGGSGIFMRDATHINDAMAQIPHELRIKTLYVLGQLKADSSLIRENAIYSGHSLAAQLKAIADGHISSPLMTDSSRPMCATVADHLLAHLDVARSKDGNGSSTPTQLGDTADEYEKMRERDRNAWKMGR